MKQMIIDERNRIEFLVGCGRTIPQTANELGRSPSTISNELVKHRVSSDKRYGCSNRLCAHFNECVRKVFSGFGERLAKNTPKCFRSCPNFREASCPRLARPPFVCNGCEKERECSLRKKFYIASVAQTQYEAERSLSHGDIVPKTSDAGRGKMKKPRFLRISEISTLPKRSPQKENRTSRESQPTSKQTIAAFTFRTRVYFWPWRATRRVGFAMAFRIDFRHGRNRNASGCLSSVM